MRFAPSALTSLLLLATAAPVLAMPRVHRGPTSPKLFKSHASTRASVHSSTSASIAPERATQIQTALVKSGYMTGEPTGVWDSSTQAALVKLQADNGWQTKFVPDSRAIIKLGLGPGSTPSAVSSNLEPTPQAAESAPDLATQ